MFLNCTDYPIASYLERHYETILGEYRQIAGEEFVPWTIEEAHDGTWLVFPLLVWNAALHGLEDLIDRNRKRCPQTVKILNQIPGYTIASFSRLGPGTHIYPHIDAPEPAVYRCHMGMGTSPDNFIRIGGDTRSWEAVKILMFDGDYLHEAANLGRDMRTIMIVDIPRETASQQIIDPYLRRRYSLRPSTTLPDKGSSAWWARLLSNLRWNP